MALKSHTQNWPKLFDLCFARFWAIHKAITPEEGTPLLLKGQAERCLSVLLAVTKGNAPWLCSAISKYRVERFISLWRTMGSSFTSVLVFPGLGELLIYLFIYLLIYIFYL